MYIFSCKPEILKLRLVCSVSIRFRRKKKILTICFYLTGHSLELLQSALSSSPTDATLLMSTGSLLLEMNEPRKALTYFEKAIDAPHASDIASQAL